MGSDHGSGNMRRVIIALTLTGTFMVVEVVGGILAGSLALLADAGHNLSDVLGLLLAWGAHFLAGRAPTERQTYGFRRGTILASLLSAILLLVGALLFPAVALAIPPGLKRSEPVACDGAEELVLAKRYIETEGEAVLVARHELSEALVDGGEAFGIAGEHGARSREIVHMLHEHDLLPHYHLALQTLTPLEVVSYELTEDPISYTHGLITH